MRTGLKPALKVGLVALVVIFLFIYFTYKLEGAYWGQEREEIRIAFEFVGQLQRGNAVRLAGVQIGSVEKISFFDRPEKDPQTGEIIRDPETGRPKLNKYVLVTAKIVKSREYALHRNSKAKIGQTGIIGDYYIELSFGSGPLLEKGHIIEGIGPFQFDDLAAEAVAVSENLQDVLINLNEIVGNRETKESFSTAIQNLAEFTERLNEITGGEETQLAEFFRNMREFSDKINLVADRLDNTMNSVDVIIAENRDNLQRTFDNTARITDELQRSTLQDFTVAVHHLKEVSQNLDRFIGQHEDLAGQTLTDIQKASEGFREAMEKVNRILDNMDTEGGLAGALLGSATAGGELKQTVEKARRLVDRTSSVLDSTKLIYEFRYFEEDESYWGDENNWRNDAGVQFDLTDDFNLYLGATDIGKETELELLLGYRYEFMTLKAGVIESEAALGLDIQPVSPLVLSVEGIGLTDEDEERLDLHGRLRLHKNLYATFGVQDVGDESFINGGLRLEL